jgi:hypothetical protein
MQDTNTIIQNSEELETALNKLKAIKLIDETETKEYECNSLKIGYETIHSLNQTFFKGLKFVNESELSLDYSIDYSNREHKLVCALIKKFFGIAETKSLDDFNENQLFEVTSLIKEAGFLALIIKVSLA